MLIRVAGLVGLCASALSCIPSVTEENVSKPLLLTPLIKKNQLQQAKKLASVGRLNDAYVPSYSGYLTVNETTGSNLFFWFFPAASNPGTAPTLLWLQGGPGSTSLFGLFNEHGPYQITADRVAHLRNTSWTQLFNMLYIDNPVGTGFSFTTSEAGYVSGETEAARDLVEALQQFFALFNEYSKNDFYITGESFAGKYVPALGYALHQKRNEELGIARLTGLAIGDGLCDPPTMLNYADFLLQTGLVDQLQATELRNAQKKIEESLAQENYTAAHHRYNDLFDKYNNFTSLSHYNILWAHDPESLDYFVQFVQSAATRRAIHVGNTNFANLSNVVFNKFDDSYMRSAKPWLAELMDHYKVMIYNGQFDVIVAAPLTAAFVNSIEWKGAQELARSKRIIWRNRRTGDPAGYVRQAARFTEVMVRNAGHMVPHDQPENAYDMIDRFVNDKPFD